MVNGYYFEYIVYITSFIIFMSVISGTITNMKTHKITNFQVGDNLIITRENSYFINLDNENLSKTSYEIFNTKLKKPNFCVIVNSTIYPAIKTELDLYSVDLNTSGYDTKIITGAWSTIEQVRAILRNEWQNNGSIGTLLIGNFPVPWYFDKYQNRIFPIDLYYMDLDGVWVDSNNDSVFDDHLGNVAPDIIFGRLPAHILSGDETQLIINYFRKVHLYRIGQLKLPNKNLVYVDDDWIPEADGWKKDAQINYENVTLVTDAAKTCAKDYKKRLLDDYEFIEVHCHTNNNYNGHNFKANSVFEPEDVNYLDIKHIDPHTFFTILFTCGAANYTIPDFLAGWYVFADTYGLISISSTKIGGMRDYDEIYMPLSENKTIGKAFKEWFMKTADTYSCKYYGMTIIGDPLLKTNQYDLEYENITFSNPNPYNDETINIYPKIRNQLDNCSDVEVKLYNGFPDSGGKIIGEQIVDFGWNETVELNYSWKTSAGEHEFWVIIDSPNEVNELNEINNMGFMNFTVFPLPDVKIISNRTAVYTYEKINFSGCIYGGHREIIGYNFDFGDGNNSGWLERNYVSYNYWDNGLYNVKLEIIDTNDCYMVSPEITITVHNRAPVAIIEMNLMGETLKVQTGDIIIFNASKSYDFDGYITSYYWEFGDYIIDYSISVEHSYNDDGIYKIKLIIVDDDGISDEISTTLIVLNRPPIIKINISKNEVNTNSKIYFNGTVEDFDGKVKSIIWDFGDGNTSSKLCATHQYSNDGIYIVNFTAKDDDGGETWTIIEMVINNVPPKAQFSVSPKEGNLSTVFNFYSSSYDSDGMILNYTWKFGDGNLGYGEKVSHQYSWSSNYTIILKIWDDDGEMAEITHYLIIENPVVEISSDDEDENKKPTQSNKKNSNLFYMFLIFVIVIIFIILMLTLILYFKFSKKKQNYGGGEYLACFRFKKI